MNIIIIGRKHKESFALHILETLINMGHTSSIYEPGFETQLTNSPLKFKIFQIKSKLYNIYSQTFLGKKHEQNKLKLFFKGKKIDLVLSCHDFLTPYDVKWMKDNFNCKVALWFPDAVSNFGKAMFLDSGYDFLFFKEPFIVDILKRELGKNAFYLPECCNPLKHKKIILNDNDHLIYDCDITTAGNLHTARSTFFKNLQDYDIKIWGNPAPTWMNTNGIKKMIQNKFVSNDDKSKAFIASKIVLNTFHPTEIYGVNVRLFEVAATSSFQICNYRKGIEDLYKIDEEIVIYNTLDELKLKIDYYLNNPDLRENISNKAYERTILEHTYEKRLKELLKIIFNW